MSRMKSLCQSRSMTPTTVFGCSCRANAIRCMITMSRFRDAVEQNASAVRKMQFRQQSGDRRAARGRDGMTMKLLQVAMVGMTFLTAGSVRVSGGQVFPQQPISGQRQNQVPGMPSKPTTGINPDDPDPLDAHRAEKQAKLQNDDRQKRLGGETDTVLVRA